MFPAARHTGAVASGGVETADGDMVAVVIGEVSTDGPGLGLEALGDGDGEAAALAQPTRRDRHTDVDPRILNIRGTSTTRLDNCVVWPFGSLPLLWVDDRGRGDDGAVRSDGQDGWPGQLVSGWSVGERSSG
jgi:hypothetical protein